MIKIKSQSYTIDWVSENIHKINPNKVFGFELHWRTDSWHIIVKTKDKCTDGYYSYDLNHWIMFQDIVKFVANPEVRILKILNYHSSNNFTKELLKMINAVGNFEK